MKTKRLASIVCLIIFMICSGGVSAVNNKYKEYYNDRYLFSILVPTNFKGCTQPTNNDGLQFTNGKSKLVASGINNVLDQKPKESYSDEIANIKGSIKYKMLKNNYYVISWIDNGYVYYRKCVVGKKSKNEFEFSYPVSNKKIYNPMVSVIASSFKTPGINDYH